MRKQLTAEQIEKRDARKAQFRALWKQVAAMPELERIQLANKLGIVTVDGHELSLANTMLVALQNPAASIVGGFRQWINHGRAVMKGQHGMMIWVPVGGRKNDAPLDGSNSSSAVADGAPESENDTRFIIGTVFDIGQTQEIETGKPEPELMAAQAA